MAEFETERVTIAQQVIKSAGDVLRAAGFDREEIGSFFRQAADHLSGGTSQTAAEPGPATGVTKRLVAEFANSPAGREFTQLNAQGLRLGLPGSDAPLSEHFDLAMKMIPLIAEAQNGLRAVAGNAGLQVFADRRVAGAAETGALYFDDFQPLWAGGFDLIGALIAALSQRGDEEAFAFLLESLLENSVVISFELKEAIERAAEALSSPS